MNADIKKIIKSSNFSAENSNKQLLLQKLLERNRELREEKKMKEQQQKK